MQRKQITSILMSLMIVMSLGTVAVPLMSQDASAATSYTWQYTLSNYDKFDSGTLTLQIYNEDANRVANSVSFTPSDTSAPTVTASVSSAGNYSVIVKGDTAGRYEFVSSATPSANRSKTVTAPLQDITLSFADDTPTASDLSTKSPPSPVMIKGQHAGASVDIPIYNQSGNKKWTMTVLPGQFSVSGNHDFVPENKTVTVTAGNDTSVRIYQASDNDSIYDFRDAYETHAKYTTVITDQRVDTGVKSIFAELGKATTTTVTVEGYNADANQWTTMESRVVSVDSAPRAVNLDVNDSAAITKYRVTLHGQDSVDSGVIYESTTSGTVGIIVDRGVGSTALIAGFGVVIAVILFTRD